MNRMSRAGRKAQILDILSKRWCAYSTHGLARACGLKPTNHFRGIVYEMYRENTIGGWKDCKENGREVYYWIHPDRNAIHGQTELGI